jgi:hypothetical protein
MHRCFRDVDAPLFETAQMKKEPLFAPPSLRIAVVNTVGLSEDERRRANPDRHGALQPLPMPGLAANLVTAGQRHRLACNAGFTTAGMPLY